MRQLTTEIAIVGGGGAGLSAAEAAKSCGREVLLVDENPGIGGQIWKSDAGDENPNVSRLSSLSRDQMLLSATVFDATNESLLIAASDEPVRLRFEKLIIASGAREVLLPFPGWTLPGVFSVGGLQSLVKGGLDVSGKRIVISGSGPLLPAVAKFLTNRGAIVPGVYEQAKRSSLTRFGISLLAHPKKLSATFDVGLSTIQKVIPSSWITQALGSDKVESVRVRRNGTEETIECDFAAVGYHLVPNLELPYLLGCHTDDNGAIADMFGQTSIANVFAAGETLGIAGIDAACDTGTAAGYAASEEIPRAEILMPKLRQHERFRLRLRKTFSLRDELRQLPDRETILCRCEDVKYGSINGMRSSREVKLLRRCGMGLCQGRVCGTALRFLKGWDPGSVKPPLIPVENSHLFSEE